MKDKWINTGYEDDELKPYIEPELDFKELKRIGKLRVCMCRKKKKLFQVKKFQDICNTPRKFSNLVKF